MTAYVAYLRKESDSDYGIDFPDFPGCVSAGHTVEEALAMAAEALTGHVAVMTADGDPVPPPSGMESLLSDPLREDAVMVLVPLDTDLLKAERVNITLPRSLLGRIDAVSGGNRSRFLVEAAEAKLAS